MDEEPFFISWLKNHPGFVITLAFIALNLVGLWFSFSAFEHFGLNYFDFADTADILLQSFRRMAMTLIVLGMTAIVLYILFHLKLQRRGIPLILVSLAIALLVIFLPLVAFNNYTVNNILLGRASIYDITLIREKDVAPTPNPEISRASIIGRAGDVIVFYILYDCSVQIVPKSTIRYMTFVRNKSRLEEPYLLLPPQLPSRCETSVDENLPARTAPPPQPPAA